MKRFTSKTGLFLRFELIFLIFFVVYGSYKNHWSESKLTFLDYTLLSILGSFAFQTLNRFNEIINYLKF